MLRTNRTYLLMEVKTKKHEYIMLIHGCVNEAKIDSFSYGVLCGVHHQQRAPCRGCTLGLFLPTINSRETNLRALTRGRCFKTNHPTGFHTFTFVSSRHARAFLNVCYPSGAARFTRQQLHVKPLAKCARRPAPHGADGWTERSGAIGRIS